MQSQGSQALSRGDRFTVEFDPEIIFSLISSSVNIISCSYVLFRLYRRNGVISSDIKYPVHFAISYLLYSIMQITNLVIKNSNLFQPGVLYGILGKFHSIFLTTNLLLIGFLEFSAYLKASGKMGIESERCDIYMWQGMILLSWVASIFGINRYEFLELRHAFMFVDLEFDHHFNAILIFIVLAGAISYFFELRKNLRKILSREFINRKTETEDHKNPNVIRACLFFIVPFLIQWSLILIYNILEIIGNNDSFSLNISLNIFLVIAVNIGGIGNAISYFIYERKSFFTDILPTTCHPIASYGALPTDEKLVIITV